MIFLGGNGHCAARLAGARAAITRLVERGEMPLLELRDVPYPGCEDRPRAADLEAFLRTVSDEIASARGDDVLIYGTGIGGLLALCLRARGEVLDLPILLQAPVLWGLERRWMYRADTQGARGARVPL